MESTIVYRRDIETPFEYHHSVWMFAQLKKKHPNVLFQIKTKCV